MTSDVQRSAKQLRPLAHAADPCSTTSTVRFETHAVVPDLELDPPIAASESYLHARGVRVFMNIEERFLDDPKECYLCSGGNRKEWIGLEAGLDTALSAEALAVLPDGGYEP